MASGLLLRCTGMNIFRNAGVQIYFKPIACSLCTQALSKDAESVEYPPVKPKFPQGMWGKMDARVAWKLHEKADQLHAIPRAKERLEDMAGSKRFPIWQLQPLGPVPETMAYKQYVTKTHVMQGWPEIYDAQCEELSRVCERLKPLLIDLLVQENEGHYKIRTNAHQFPAIDKNLRVYPANVLLGQIVRMLYSVMACDKDYLLRSQLDKDVRVESFWYRGGYDRDGVVTTGRSFSKDSLRFQVKQKSSYQIRTELPLPEFVSMEDPLCHGEVPEFNYVPSTVFQTFLWERPISVSGHWIEDPCEFHLMSVNVLDYDYDNFKKTHGQKLAHEETKTCALVSGFASTVSQAHNQGFNYLWDLTYPITSQVVITDGHHFRFGAYQLNTLQLWKDDTANPRRNLMWATELMPLFDVIEGGQVKGFNEDVLRHLVQFVCLAPQERGVDLRPYLPEEVAPRNKRLFISHKGEEPLPHPVIGRFQYPVNAVYF